MALNTDLIGRTFPPSAPYEVSRVKIKEFATAIGDFNPAYHDREAAQAMGHPDVIAPPTFAIIITFQSGASLVFDPALGLDYSRVVHGEQSFTHHRSIRAGDVLVSTASIKDIRVAGRNELLTWQAELTTPEGELVCTATNTLVSRGTAPEAS